jgi:hypothetical protein
MPSFDIVSRSDMAEFDNVVQGAGREFLDFIEDLHRQRLCRPIEAIEHGEAEARTPRKLAPRPNSR